MKELPPKYRTITESETLLKFTPLMRLKVLIGYRLRIQHQVASVNSPGRTDARFHVTLTKQLE